jgi:hypothetical protein
MNKWISTILLVLVIGFAFADSTNFPFTVSDDITPLAYLKVTAASSDTNFIPNRYLSIEGDGSNRFLVVRYDLDKPGVSKITVGATDEAQKTSESSFNFAVHPLPILKIKSLNGMPVLYWDSVSNYNYKLYHKVNVAGAWSNILSINALGAVTSYTNETEGTQGFFKLGY